MEKSKKRNILIILVVFLVLAVIVAAILLAVFLPKKKEKPTNVDAFLNFTIDPMIISSSETTHIGGAESFVFDLSKDESRGSEEIEAALSYGQSVCYNYSLENPSSQDIYWTIHFSDLSAKGFKIFCRISNVPGEASVGESVSNKIKANETQTIQIIFRYEGEKVDGASISGSLILSASIFGGEA